ncbi:hypothetical protein C2G38_2074653, partial [Gigaspora rosea]
MMNILQRFHHGLIVVRQNMISDITEIPYKFNLLLRGTRDGFTYKTFHQLCNNIPCTVVVI